jgi:enoyl-CoA hydratase
MAAADTSPSPTILVERDGDVLTVTFNRPDKLNALSFAMCDAIDGTLAALASGQDDARVVVLRGGGRGFSGGVDLADVEALLAMPAPQARATVRRWQRLFEAIEDLEKPVVAVLHGFAVGGGLELAMACDIRIAEEGTKFSLPEARLGALPDGGSQRLARIVGLGRAKDLILTGRTILADEAQQIGLVSHTFPAGGADDAIGTVVDRLLASSPLGAGLAKRVLNRGFGTDLRGAMELELLASGPLYATEDMSEGIAAMREKRPPSFKGR